MTATYFLTGSYKDIDNDFELNITIPADTVENTLESKDMYNVVFTDISSEDKLVWQTSQPSFLLCLSDMDDFLLENHITLYSKILTSPQRENAVDKELEGFILNRLEY